MQNLPIVELTNFSDCLLGQAESFGNIVLAYDGRKIIEKIKKDQNCDYNQANQIFYSQVNQNYGPKSPVFLFPVSKPPIDV